MRDNMKEEKPKSKRNAYETVLIRVMLSIIIIYVMGLVFDLLPCIHPFLSKLVHWLFGNRINWDGNHDILKDMYGNIWVITIGILIFGITQRGYGIIHGLSMSDILRLAFSKRYLLLFVCFFVGKYLIFAIFYLCDFHYSLFLAQIESVVILLFITFGFFILSSFERVAQLLKQDTQNFIDQINDPEKNKLHPEWKLKTAVKRMDLNSNDDCMVLKENILLFLRNIKIPDIESEDFFTHMDLHIESTHMLGILLQQFFISNVSFEHIRLFIKGCLNSLNGTEEIMKQFVLIRSFLSSADIQRQFAPENVLDILGVLTKEDEKTILRYLLLYFEFYYQYSDSQGWCYLFLGSFWNRYKEIGGSYLLEDWKKAALALYIEYAKKERKHDTETIRCESEIFIKKLLKVP